VSVINRVLVDLEKRHARNGDPHPSATEIRAVETPSDRGSRKSLVTVLLALALVALAMIAWQWTSNGMGPRIPEAAPVPVVQAPVRPAPVSAPPAAAEAPPAIVAPAPAPIATVKAPAPRVAPLALAPEAKDPEAMPETRPVAKPRTAAPRMPTENTAPPEITAPAAIEKRDRPPSPAERADAQFRQGAQAMQQGHMRDAEASFLAAIAEDPGHVPARQALLGLYLESQRKDEAEILVRDGIKAGNRPTSWVMLLARLEADHGDVAGAINTMRSHLDIGRQNGDYLALLAALLQKQGQHKEAVEQYQAAIALGAGKPAWFMGLGISLRGLGRRDEANAAFQRALDSGGLSPDLKVFVERQMTALRAAPAN
jgi:MSHA biogenesis protein MshN